MSAPEDVIELAQQRQQARTDRDFAQADQLRDQIRDLGWLVLDTAGGFELNQAPPFPTVPNVSALPKAINSSTGHWRLS